ncbi:hypothetical protein BDW02DRAFT_578424 [Decorospora gaudefroyi]|uniref:Uncharacterized protein n=1 Tax=Decorospora gaudefroyi TaxID=184978 RepID=A0A6A5KK54_9PLEO|nr:hypothetical protein BDW02DRAFT_578424 [Decorospora gaudefroyi]
MVPVRENTNTKYLSHDTRYQFLSVQTIPDWENLRPNRDPDANYRSSCMRLKDKHLTTATLQRSAAGSLPVRLGEERYPDATSLKRVLSHPLEAHLPISLQSHGLCQLTGYCLVTQYHYPLSLVILSGRGQCSDLTFACGTTHSFTIDYAILDRIRTSKYLSVQSSTALLPTARDFETGQPTIEQRRTVYMSDRPSETSSPSNSSKPRNTRTTPEAIQSIISSATSQDFREPPQLPAEQTVSTPKIIVTESHSPTPETTPQQNQSLAIRHRSSSLQPPGQAHSSTPSEHSPSQSSFISAASLITTSATTIAMSSSTSSPSNTSSTGSTAGSGHIQLPYAPFPYPMPASPRGGQQQGGQGK